MNPPALPSRKPVEGSTELAPPLPLLHPPPLPPRASTSREKLSMEQRTVDYLTSTHIQNVPIIQAIPSTITQASQVEAVERRQTQPEQEAHGTRAIEPYSTPFSSTSESSTGTSSSKSAAEGSPLQPVQQEEALHVELPSLPVDTGKIGRLEQKDGPIPLSATRDLIPNTAPPLPSRNLGGTRSEHHPRTRPPVEPQDPYIPLPVPPLPLLLLLSIPLFLAYLSINLILLCGSFVGTWYIWADWKRKMIKRGEYGPEVDREKVKGLRTSWQGERHKEESVEWMNHVLKALFPLITTDLLTPFIDLLEDALLTQVPPVISSVRLVSPSLGEEPVRIESMRPMSDEEWFDNLSEAPSAPSNKDGILATTAGTLRQKILPRKSKDTEENARVAKRSEGKVADLKTRALESDQRRKRDKILRRIGGRRGQGVGTSDGQSMARSDQAQSAVGHSGFSEGTTVRGEEQDEDGEDKGDGGEYVNFAVDFSYDGRKNRNGWDLHFLAYFGIGLKGVGGTEVPIWVEMLKITGTMHVRLLLCPDVPFVRSAAISLPKLPEFDFAAKPIKDISLDFMGLPFIKPFIERSILEVAGGFVRPQSYRLDVDRLLMGQEAALRTEAIGVLHIRLHRARKLASADAFGSSDPYATVSFSKFSKPMFATRTIVDTLDPRWEEDAYILITPDAIESGERLRIVVYDSDRFSADDAIGMVDEDLADLLERGNHRPKRDQLLEEETILVPTRNGMPAEGCMLWAHAFYPLWKMPQDSDAKKEIGAKEWQKESHGEDDIGTGRGGGAQVPGLIYAMMGRMKPEPLPWEAERRKRRMESIAWLTGERARESMEASLKPSLERRSGILHFGVLQGMDVELKHNNGTFGSQSSKKGSSAAGGKPALDVDPQPWEGKPPSAYAEVILNGKLVYRTRTKQLSPAPYWNATGERFIRDWTKARLVVVVRDERDREHDPILGLTSIELSHTFDKGSQITRSYPLVGGVGHGLIRVSLLFKAVDAKLPFGISSYEVATIRLNRLSLQRPPGWTTYKLQVEIQTDSETRRIPYEENPVEVPDSARLSTSSRKSVGSTRSLTERSSNPTLRPDVLDWKLEDRKHCKVLAVEYRHSCFLVFRFSQRGGKLKKDSHLGLACLRLQDVRDNSVCDRMIPIYETSSINEACDLALDRTAALQREEIDPHHERPMLHVAFNLYSGISHAHRKLTKRDPRMLHVYQAWQNAEDVGGREEVRGAKQRGKQIAHLWQGDGPELANDDGLDSESSVSDPGSSDNEFDGQADGTQEAGQHEDAEIAHRELSDADDYEEPTSAFGRWVEHNRMLSRQQKGLMQNTFMRNLQFGKDKVRQKLLSGKAVAKRAHRPHGADIDVEMEGISKI